MIPLKEEIKREREKKALDLLSKFLVAKDILFQHYVQIMEPILTPDLFGKTVRVTNKNFPSIDKKRNLISRYLNINPPEIFVYENFYYGADTVGLTNPWIEISAKTINEFSDKEITFIISRQISHIYLKHYINRVHAEQLLRSLNIIEQTPGINLVNLFGTIDALEKAFQLVYYQWHREINHTADIYGLLFCGDLTSAASSIIKLIINDKDLSEKVILSDYLNQRDYLVSLKGIISFYTKLDESVPYGPLRLEELIKFLTIGSNKTLFLKMKNIQEELNVQ